MANEKDVSEKSLESYNDVFSDIVNGCMFNGRNKVREDELLQAREDELLQARERSFYKGEDRLREQERDAAKFWKNGTIRLALYGLENETEPDKDMPLRVIGYDGAGYRDQLYSVKGEDGKYRRNNNPRYGVVTIVLYFGLDHWTAPKTLHEALSNADEDMLPFINDYKLHIVEVAWLSDEQVSRFRSDFKIVADYFVQIRKTGTYTGSEQEICHVNELMNLMEALTGDSRYEEVMPETLKGGEMNMDHFLDTVEARGYERGDKAGYERGDKAGYERGDRAGYERGDKAGYERGDKAGGLKKVIVLICKKLVKGKSLDEIADELEDDVDDIRPMYDVALRFSPDFNADKVFEAYEKEKEAVLS